MKDVTQAEWDRLQAIMPECPTCGAQTKFGFGLRGPVAVCIGCSTVWHMEVDQAAQYVAKAKQLVREGTDHE